MQNIFSAHIPTSAETTIPPADAVMIHKTAGHSDGRHEECGFYTVQDIMEYDNHETLKHHKDANDRDVEVKGSKIVVYAKQVDGKYLPAGTIITDQHKGDVTIETSPMYIGFKERGSVTVTVPHILSGAMYANLKMPDENTNPLYAAARALAENYGQVKADRMQEILMGFLHDPQLVDQAVPGDRVSNAIHATGAAKTPAAAGH